MDTIPLSRLLTWLQPVDFPHKLGIMDRIFGHSLARRNVCWVRTAAGIPWKLDLRNSTHRWVVYGKYEGEAFLNWARRHLPADGVVVDSGANIGQMLLYLSQWVPRGKVLAFEPGTTQADWLEACLRANSSLPVELIRAGVGPALTTLRLCDQGSSLTHGGQSFISETDGATVAITRLDDELVRRNIACVHLWKLDVEGFEVPALHGAATFLKEHRIRAVYAELHEDNGRRIWDYLSAMGYAGFLFTKSG